METEIARAAEEAGLSPMETRIALTLARIDSEATARAFISDVAKNGDLHALYGIHSESLPLRLREGTRRHRA